MDRERERERNTDTHHTHTDLARLKPTIQIPSESPTWLTKTQAVRSPFSASLGAKQGARLTAQEPGLQLLFNVRY